MTTTTAIARVEAPAPARTGIMRPVVRPAEIIEAHKEAAEIIRDALEDGRDYGRIPGAGERKVLFKAGAERLCMAFALIPKYTVVESEADHDREVHFVDRFKKPSTSRGLYRYVMKCQLERDGIVVGEGIGSCSTMESKYISRPRDCENTAIKMGKKRAYVDAVLSTLSLSDRFTQDVGDTDNDDEGDRNTKAPSPPAKPRLDQETLRAAISAEYDRIGIGVGVGDVDRSKVRAADIAVILGNRRPDCLQDLENVLGVLKDTKAKPAAREPDGIDEEQAKAAQ